MSYEVTENSTIHGENTPHGFSTPHRMPLPNGQQSLTDIFGDLSRQLYPTGRAWYMPKNGVFNNLHLAINRSFARFVESCKSTIDSNFPNSENFTLQDALLWEYRLGLPTNVLIDLEQRKQAILRKLAFPNNIKARQSRVFIESQLQLAGFNVYVHENLPPYQTPNEIISVALSEVQHSNSLQHGSGVQHGYSGYDVIANETTLNESFVVGSGNLWASFFIGGENLGDIATVPSSRIVEFKELVLKLKPAHTVVFTIINYV